MHTFLLALLITLISIAGLVVGSLLGRAPIRGSCGGIACRMGIDCAGCKSRGEGEIG